MLWKKLLREMKGNPGQFISVFLLAMALYCCMEGHVLGFGFVESAGRRMAVTGSAPECDGAQVDIYLEREDVVNRTYYISGEKFDPADTDGLWLTAAFAKARDISVSDDFTISYNGITFTRKVKGLIESPEYEYRQADGDADIYIGNIAFVYISYDAFPIRDYVNHLIGQGKITAKSVAEETDILDEQLELLKRNVYVKIRGGTAESLRLHVACGEKVKRSVLLCKQEGCQKAVKNKEHLPMMGVGPVYVAVIILLTILGIILSISEKFYFGRIEILQIPFLILGILLILCGIVMWAMANFHSKVDVGIKNNRLVTTGIYEHTRNPIYAAFLFVCTGALFIANNLWLLILPVVYWIFLTVLMKCTEEKWLLKLYGKEYEDYCKHVNRCIPWISKK